MARPVLEIRDLVITASGGAELVSGLSMTVASGSIAALVGESGCGKSLTALAVIGLLPAGVRVARGEILLDGRRIDALDEAGFLAIRGRRVAMIFQEPMTSLNPVMRIGDQIAEVYRLHAGADRAVAGHRAEAMLRKVKIPDPARRARQYPHELSGGMRQRIMIAMALAAEPDLLLADEPTTALDVTVQAQILDLVTELLAEQAAAGKRTATLVITHDMAVVAQRAERITVMYAGRDVESGGVRAVFARPAHPYTAGLLAAIPRLDGAPPVAIPGQVPRPGERPDGCAFAPRCTRAMEQCRVRPIERAPRGPDHEARCLLEAL